MVRLGTMQTLNLPLDMRQSDAQAWLNQVEESGSLMPLCSHGVAHAGWLQEGRAQVGGWVRNWGAPVDGEF